MWCEVSAMVTPSRGLGAAILDGILYVVGGSDGIAALNRVGSLVVCTHLLHVSSFPVSHSHDCFSPLSLPTCMYPIRNSQEQS